MSYFSKQYTEIQKEESDLVLSTLLWKIPRGPSSGLTIQSHKDLGPFGTETRFKVDIQTLLSKSGDLIYDIGKKVQNSNSDRVYRFTDDLYLCSAGLRLLNIAKPIIAYDLNVNLLTSTPGTCKLDTLLESLESPDRGDILRWINVIRGGSVSSSSSEMTKLVGSTDIREFSFKDYLFLHHSMRRQ